MTITDDEYGRRWRRGKNLEKFKIKNEHEGLRDILGVDFRGVDAPYAGPGINDFSTWRRRTIFPYGRY